MVEGIKVSKVKELSQRTPNRAGRSAFFQRGFTLLEILVVLIIISIISGFAVPQYSSYIKRARFAEGVMLANSLKAPVARCLIKRGAVPAGYKGGKRTGCNHRNGVPMGFGSISLPDYSEYINYVTVNAAGQIKFKSTDLLDEANYELWPNYNDGRITWTIKGNCAGAKLC